MRPRSSQVNATHAKIDWSSPISTDNPCPIQQYTVSYYPSNLKKCQPNVNETFTRRTNETELSLGNLRPFAFYKVAVTASTSAGVGQISEQHRFETDAAGEEIVVSFIMACFHGNEVPWKSGEQSFAFVASQPIKGSWLNYHAV